MEMDSSEAAENSSELSEYILSASFPECVRITNGQHISKSVQITKGDIVVIKSCDAEFVTLTFKDEVSGRRKNLNVSKDCPHGFMVLPPKESVSNRAASVIMYPSIADLLVDSPTYFEATSSYEDPNLNGTSINRGDRFRFRGIASSPGDGDNRLKALDKEGNIVFLSLDCTGNFYPLKDDYCYTLKELVRFAPVSRRLKLFKHNLQQSSKMCLKDNSDPSTEHADISNSCLSNNIKSDKDSGDILHNLPFPISGVIHMLRPELSVTVSPFNDPDTLWNIPTTANIHVCQHLIDDYEVPTVACAKRLITPLPRIIDDQGIPDFPAPSTPPLIQPLVPVNVKTFSDIYRNSFPVMAKIMDIVECNSYYSKLLSDCSDVIIHRVENTRRLYAKDVKTDSVYSFSKNNKISFNEYPKRFSSFSELANLAVGTEIVVLEDIASDFPKPFSLQFGDIIRLTSNTPVLMRVKHSEIQCKILKCERVDHEKGNVNKLKIPFDFEVSMIMSTDYSANKIISVKDLLSGSVPLPNEDVAALVDDKENYNLKDLPPTFQNLQIFPERLLIASLSYVSKEDKSQELLNKSIGISLNSGLVLAFRQRLKPSEIDAVTETPRATEIVQQQLEILTSAQYQNRQQIFKVWADEDEQDLESVSSSSIFGDSLQRSNSNGLEGKKKKKENDKMRRFSRALNPKHWRASKSIPDPLPHPEAMGLMALAARPLYEKPNEYQTKYNPPPSPLLDQTFSSLCVSSDEEEERNIYEDVVVGPIRQNKNSQSKVFSGPFHKSLPMPRIFSKSKAGRKGKKHVTRSQAQSEQSYDQQDSKLQTCDRNTTPNQFNEEDQDDAHIYECPDGGYFDISHKKITKSNSQTHDNDNHKDNGTDKSSHEPLSGITPSHYVTPLPPEPKPRNTREIPTRPDITEKNNDPCISDGSDNHSGMSSQSQSSENKKTSEETPVPSRRKKKAELTSHISVTSEKVASAGDLCIAKPGDEISNEVDPNKENSTSKTKEDHTSEQKKINDCSKPPIPKPRHTKKRTHLNHVDNYIEKNVTSHQNDSDETGVQIQSTSPSVNHSYRKTTRDKIKPKPLPKPKPRP